MSTAHLSPRQQLVIPFLQQGMDNQDIADTAHLTVTTVRQYSFKVLSKLGVGRMQLILQHLQQVSWQEQPETVEAYRQLAVCLARCPERVRHTLATYVQLWLDYTNNPRGAPPEQTDVAEALGVPVAHINKHMRAAADHFGQKQVTWFKILALAYRAQAYEAVFGRQPGAKKASDLTPLDQQILELMRQGIQESEILKRTGLDEAAFLYSYNRIWRQYGHLRVVHMLQYVDDHCPPDDELPLEAFYGAHKLISQLKPIHRDVLQVELRLWQAHRDNPRRHRRPNNLDVAAALCISEHTVCSRIKVMRTTVAGLIGNADTPSKAKMLQLYYMATMYPLAELWSQDGS